MALLIGCAPNSPVPPTASLPPAGTETPEPLEGPVAPSASVVPVTVTVVASGLQAPWAVAFAPDGRVFVTERDTGRILELVGGSAVEVQRLDVDPSGEGGLLGLAVSPNYPSDGLLYAYYTTAEDNRIVRFRLGEPPQPILVGIPSASIHDGGRIALGPDGMLYATTGDAAQSSLAQNLASFGGKILRMTPDGQPPVDNPFPGSRVYSFGHRNVQGLAWTADGTLHATEFGPDQNDEINRIVPGGNYGWPFGSGVLGQVGLIDPLLVLQPAEASWSGAAILVNGAIPQWEGNLFAAALRGQRLWRLVLAPDGGIAAAEQLLVGEFGRLRAAVQAPDGSLWVLTNNRDGRGSPDTDDDRIIRLGP